MTAKPRTRRDFLRDSIVFGAGLAAAGPLGRLAWGAESAAGMRLGLVTYLWGQDWDLPTLIANCRAFSTSGY